MAVYSPIVRLMKHQHDIRIRRWRTSMSGCAWRVCYDDGRSINWIESPRPRTPLSLSIFLHEVAHHAIGFDRYPLRCEEEYHAWAWAVNRMQQLGVEPDARVIRRVEASMQYAVSQALRQSSGPLPKTLKPFLPQAA